MKQPPHLHARDLKNLKKGDLICFDFGEDNQVNALVVEHRKDIIDFLGEGSSAGMVVYSMTSQRKFQFTYKTMVEQLNVLLVSKV